MRDRNGNMKHAKYYPPMTGEEFQIEYEKISMSKEKLPLATMPFGLPIPFGDGKFKQAFLIFYEEAPIPDKKEEPKTEPRKLDL